MLTTGRTTLSRSGTGGSSSCTPAVTTGRHGCSPESASRPSPGPAALAWCRGQPPMRIAAAPGHIVQWYLAATTEEWPAMPGSHPQAQTLAVPGARLYYERRGTGPLLLRIGSPMDSTGFAALADALAREYTVVTYDPRGIGDSSRDDTGDVTPEQQASD